MSDSPLPVIHSDNDNMGTPEPGLKRQIMSYSPSMMLVRHTMTAGWTGARHSHPHEQLIYVVRGEVHFDQPQGKAVLQAGDSLLIPGGVEHQASTPVASEVLDVFTPMREDYAV